MTDLPSTIKHPKTFNEAKPAGFDGVFDWRWMDGCFGNSKIKPMDIDCLIERKGQFLLCETKNTGVEIPEGQQITLNALHALGCFTIMAIWGKTEPKKAVAYYPDSKRQNILWGVDECRDFVKRWYEFADKRA